jgi:hypothetical protein
MTPGGLSCRPQSALAYADRRIESGERRLDVVEFVAMAKALKVILLRSLLSGDRGIVDPRPARRGSGAVELHGGAAVQAAVRVGTFSGTLYDALDRRARMLCV